MNFWEYLDRRGERRAQNSLFRLDTKTLIGFGFLAGYYVLVYRFSLGGIPADNLPLVRDAMLTLGPPVGLIVGAIFRTDERDLQQTANTGRAFTAITAAAKAGTGNGAPAVATPEESP